MSECVILSAGVDISDADAVVGDVKSPKTFYSIEEPKKTGTMPTVAIVAANDNYPAGYHAGDAGGLDAIDTDLAPANIKSGVTIFGKLGTFTGSPSDDQEGYDQAVEADISGAGTEDIPAQSEWEVIDAVVSGVASNAGIVGYGGGRLGCYASGCSNKAKVRLYIDNVQVEESAYIVEDENLFIQLCHLSYPESGDIEVSLRVYNYSLDIWRLSYWNRCVGGYSFTVG